MRKILLALAALALVAPAFVAPAAYANEGGEKKEGDPSSQYVDITPVAVPIIVADGRLVNYVFIQVRVNLTPKADATKLREKEPYLRDALVKASFRTPFTVKTDYMHVDEAALKAAVVRDAGPILGAKNVTSVQIMTQQPKQRIAAPRPAAS